jgi:hypothetical protein
MRQIVHPAGREAKARFGHVQPAGIGDGRHLDRRFGAVEKAVEHLRVHARAGGFLGRQAIVAPDVIGGDVMIGGQVFRALARGGDGEARGAGPVDHLGHQRGLVAVSHGIDDALGAGLGGQHGAGQHVGLDVDHDHVAACLDGGAGVAQARLGRAGGLDHHLHIGGAGLRAAVHETGGGDQGVVPARRADGGAGAVGVKVGDHRHRQPAMRGTWARNMVPNLPAPIRAARTGRPSAARAAARV